MTSIFREPSATHANKSLINACRLNFNQELTVGDDRIRALKEMDLLGIAELGYLCVCHVGAPYDASTPKMMIRLASMAPGQNGDFITTTSKQAMRFIICLSSAGPITVAKPTTQRRTRHRGRSP